MDIQELDLTIRKTGIGSSEIAAICGLNPYMTAFDVYLEKTAKSDPVEPSDAMLLGKRLEQTILNLYCERTGTQVLPMFNQTIRHKERPWQLATPDGIRQEIPKLVECKNVGRRMAVYWGEEGTDEVPKYYLVQAIWQESALGIAEADIAALIGGDTFRIYEVPFDQELEELLLERAEKFWNKCVLADIPPQAQDSARAQAYLKKRFPRELGLVRQATAADLELMQEYKEIERRKLEAEKEFDSAKLRLELAIGDDEGIEGYFGRVTWTAYTTNRLDTKGIRESHPKIAAEFEKASTVRRLLARWA